MRIRISLRKIEFQISIFICVIVPLMFLAGFIKEYAAAFLSITLHEIGHIAAAGFYGYVSRNVQITPMGLSVFINNRDCSRVNSIKIYLAGPAVNMLIFCTIHIMSFAFQISSSYLSLLSATNLYLALFNLIPAFPLDGGRILLEVLAGRMGLLAAGRLIRRMASIISIVLLAVGIYQLYLTAFNFSLIIIGLYIAFLLNTWRMESAFMNIKQIIYRRSKLLKKGIYAARDLVVIKTTLLSDTLNNMDFDKFHFVYVLDEDLKLLRVFTENEILDAIVEGDNNTTFETLLEV